MVAGRHRLDDGRRPCRVEPGEQDAGLDLGARDRQLVADALQLAAFDDERRHAVRGLDPRAHLRERLGDALHRPRARSDSSPVSSKRPRWPARIPASSRSERARVAAVDRLAGLAQAAQARRRRRGASSRRPRATVTPSARTAAIVDSVSPERPKPRTRVSPSPIAPTSTARCEIDLSPGTAMWPRSAAAGSISHSRRAPARRRRRSPAPRAAPPRVAPRPRRVTSSVSVPPRSRRDVVELEVLDVDPLRAERLRDPGEHARAGRARGREAAAARPDRGYASASMRRRLSGGLADPAGEEAGVARVERVPRAARRAGGARRATRGSAAALSRKMSTQMRGFAPATRVMSRSEPPGGGERLVTLDPRRAGLVHEQVRKRVRQVARERDEAVVRLRVDRDRRRRRARRRSRARAGSAPDRSRRAASGTRSRRRRARRWRARRRAPRSRRPGWPPTKRASRGPRPQTPVLVEPTSVTVVSSPLASSTAAPAPASAATGAATTASSAPATAASERPAARRRRRARRPTSSAVGSGSKPRDARDARRASRRARPTRRSGPCRRSRGAAPPRAQANRRAGAGSAQAGSIPNPHPPGGYTRG